MEEETSSTPVVVGDSKGKPVTFENRTASPMQPQERRFLRVNDIMQDLDCSETYAYRLIRKINDELSKRGLMTFRGRILKKAYLQYTEGGL